MNNAPSKDASVISDSVRKGACSVTLVRGATLYARIALGAAFLSAVADRFGLWGKYGGWGNFAKFTEYTGQVNSFMPDLLIPFRNDAATAADATLGIRSY